MSSKSLTFVGGGRWASIVLKELLKVAPNLLVDWVCKLKIKDKSTYLKSSEIFKNVSLNYKKKFYRNKNSKIIIASHSSQHCKDLLTFADVNAEILIEKPLFSTIEDFDSIISAGIKNIFINLEFYYAYFIRDFYKEIESITFKKLEFIWHDPLYEKRINEDTKYSEIYSSIFLDQLLHVISICKVFKLDPESFTNITINKNNFPDSDCIKIDFLSGKTNISISLSRLASTRERKIILNNKAVELNFSEKPTIYIDQVFQRDLSVSDRLYPVAETLKKFLDFPNSTEISDISIESLLPFLRFCFVCEEKFIHSLVNEISLLSTNEMNSESFKPIFAYHAGIMYYRQLLKLSSSCNIHFFKGDKGLSLLKGWWFKFIESSSFKY